MNNPDNTLDGLVRSATIQQVHVSPQAIDQRFNESAVRFLKAILEILVNFVISAEKEVDWALVKRFPHVYVHDSTQIALPVELIEIWKGCGHTAASASLKIDLLYDLNTGKSRVHLRHGVDADNKSPLLDDAVELGSVHLKDLGYFKLERMEEQGHRGEYFVSRFPFGTHVYASVEDKYPIDLQELMLEYRKAGIRYAELEVYMGAKKRLKVRLVMTRISDAAAARNRAQTIKKAKDKGRTASDAQLAQCDFWILVTNVPAKMLAKEEAPKLYGARWQIELMFKLWKSKAKIDESRSKKPWRILCEVYVKLLIVIIQHWIFLIGFWTISPRSLMKGSDAIQEQAYALAACIGDRDKLVGCLQTIDRILASKGCMQNKRKQQPGTWQRLEEVWIAKV
jgi:hypothetical protein